MAALAACDHSSPVAPPDPNADEGTWITDQRRTIDDFKFSDSTCLEVFPPGSANIDSLPAGSVTSVEIVATACYHATVRIEDSLGDSVRALDVRFGIFNRTDAEKNRGVDGWIPWDGKDGNGHSLPAGPYLWRLNFDFGNGQIRKFRSLVRLY